MPIDSKVSILGVVFEGIDSILDYVCNQTDNSQPYIVSCCERFPCFDDEDYATESRYYRNYLFCRSKQEADQKVWKMKELPEKSNFCLVRTKLPADMRPMVYYEDEDTSFLLAF